MVGLAIGIIRMGLEWSRPPVPCGSPEVSDVFTVVSKIHYLHFAMILFTCTFIVEVCVSFVTEPRAPEKVKYAHVLNKFKLKQNNFATILSLISFLLELHTFLALFLYILELLLFLCLILKEGETGNLSLLIPLIPSQSP